MRNPYEILGIHEGASPDTIKKAYRELVKKYHPDQYNNNPLSDLAEEKLKEINQAYDHLMKQAEASGHQSNQYGHNQQYAQNQTQYQGYNERPQQDRALYDQARVFINNGNLAAAQDVLNRISYRDAEWYYLSGLVFMRKGWYNEAGTNLHRAASMDPNNHEYRQALNNLNYTNNHYQSTVYHRKGHHRGGPDMCGICQCMICTDCCCECAGGDFIECC